MDWISSRNLPAVKIKIFERSTLYRKIFKRSSMNINPFLSHFIAQSPSRGLLYKNDFLGVFYSLKLFPRSPINKYLLEVLYALTNLQRYF